MKKFLGLLFSALLLLNSDGCGDSTLVRSDNVQVIKGVSFSITERIVTTSGLVAKGIVKNTGKGKISPPWYVEGDFYADDSYALKLGGDNFSINFALYKGESTAFELRFSSGMYNEADYPNFAVRNLRAYYEN